MYHIQVAAEACWCEVIDPDGSKEEVDVWLSDQGFSTEKQKTWPLDDALSIVDHFYKTGQMHPGYTWT